MRYLVGLNQDEIARALGVSEPTVRRHWVIARAWLYAEMKANEGPALANGNDGDMMANKAHGGPKIPG